jgi:hypothetical protein
VVGWAQGLPKVASYSGLAHPHRNQLRLAHQRLVQQAPDISLVGHAFDLRELPRSFDVGRVQPYRHGLCQRAIESAALACGEGRKARGDRKTFAAVANEIRGM